MSYFESKFWGTSIEYLKNAISNPVNKREFRRLRRLMPKFKTTELLYVIWYTMRPIEREVLLRSHNNEICDELDHILNNRNEHKEEL